MSVFGEAEQLQVLVSAHRHIQQVQSLEFRFPHNRI